MAAQRTVVIGAVGLAALAAGAAGQTVPPAGQVTIRAIPASITVGTTAGIGGRVTGAAVAAGTPAVLLSDTAPFGPFRTLATGAVNGAGEFGFRVTPLANTRYRVRIGGTRPLVSPDARVLVRMRVSLRVSDAFPERGQLVRFFGSVAPAHPGLVLRIQKRNPDGSFRSVARIPVPATSSTRSSPYAGEIPITRNGVYRIVAPGHGDHLTARSALRLVRTDS